jgi:hypothetical protein
VGERGGTGRRAGFRSRCPQDVGVRIPPLAPPADRQVRPSDPVVLTAWRINDAHLLVGSTGVLLGDGGGAGRLCG